SQTTSRQDVRISEVTDRGPGSSWRPLYPMVLPRQRCHQKVNTSWLTAPRKYPTNSSRLIRPFLVAPKPTNHLTNQPTKPNQPEPTNQTPNLVYEFLSLLFFPKVAIHGGNRFLALPPQTRSLWLPAQPSTG